MKQWLLLILFASTVTLLSVSSHAGPKGELVLKPQLTRELNQVLKIGDAVHHALVIQDEEQTDLSLRDLVQQIDRARSMSYLAKAHERAHLVRILDGAREQFELTQAAYGQERRNRLEDGFNQLVNLVRIYRLDRSYAIYFCPKDKATWVQTGTKPKNPFRSPASSREPCGMRVQR